MNLALRKRVRGFLFPHESMREIQTNIGDWAVEKIKGATWHGNLQHLRNEIVELEVELQQWSNLGLLNDEFFLVKDRLRKEMADIVILIAHLARLTDVDLTEAILDKMEINYKRQWSSPDQDGVIHHV